MRPRPILIDTDTGVDDALAILFALRSPEVSVKAITTVAGNVQVHKCTRNVRTLLTFLEAADLPIVSEGARKPLQRPLVTAPEVHGRDGLGNINVTNPKKAPSSKNKAIETIIGCCAEHQKRLTIIAIGPLTNLALAFKKNPSTLKKVGCIISMGGAFRVPGNTGPVAEFNYFVDPDAAECVLNAGLPVTILPLDITQQCVLLRSELEYDARLRHDHYAKFILQMTKGYMKYHLETEGFNGGYLHDPLAVAVAIDPTLIQIHKKVVHVECHGIYTSGMTIAERSNVTSSSVIQVAVQVDRERFLRMFRERLWI